MRNIIDIIVYLKTIFRTLAKKMIEEAADRFEEIRRYGKEEQYVEYQEIMYKIRSYAKTSEKYGSEYQTKVAELGKKTYTKIISNTMPYGKQAAGWIHGAGKLYIPIEALFIYVLQ